jgi:hypothetical protein
MALMPSRIFEVMLGWLRYFEFSKKSAQNFGRKDQKNNFKTALGKNTHF